MTSSLETINVRRMMMKIERDLNVVARNLFEESPEEVTYQKACESILQTYKDRGLVSDFTVPPSIKRMRTWAELYPSKRRRALAFLARLFKAPLYESKPRWYHRILPYRCEYLVRIDDDFFDDSIAKNSVEKYVSAYYAATIVYPHEVLDQDIAIMPIQPISTITLTLTIDKEGASCAPSATT